MKKAIQLDPNNSVYHHMRGWWLIRDKRYEEALRECRIALDLDPNNPFAYHTMSYTYEEMGDCAKAVEYARKALSLRPGEANLINNLKRVEKKCNKPAANASPLIGVWRWFNGAQVHFCSNGKSTAYQYGQVGNTGNWSYIDQSRLIIKNTWKIGGWVDTLQLSADGKSLKGQNQNGNKVTANKINGSPKCSQ